MTSEPEPQLSFTGHPRSLHHPASCSFSGVCSRVLPRSPLVGCAVTVTTLLSRVLARPSPLLAVNVWLLGGVLVSCAQLQGPLASCPSAGKPRGTCGPSLELLPSLPDLLLRLVSTQCAVEHSVFSSWNFPQHFPPSALLTTSVSATGVSPPSLQGPLHSLFTASCHLALLTVQVGESRSQTCVCTVSKRQTRSQAAHSALKPQLPGFP